MTGNHTKKQKNLQVYMIWSVEIPPNIEVNRVDKNDQIYMTKREKYNAVLDLVKSRNKITNQFLYITSVENSLNFRFYEKENLKHNVLNAKNHMSEAKIIEKWVCLET